MTTAPSAALQDATPDPRAPRRVRHEPRRRELSVKRVDKISAHMIRVALGGDLAGFTSLGFDDHIKLFFPQPPAPGGEPSTRPRSEAATRPCPVPSTSTTGAIEQLNAQSNGSSVTSLPAMASSDRRSSSPPRIRHDTPVHTRTIRARGSASRNSG